MIKEDLRKWFKDRWVRLDTKGNIKGDCAREEGEGKPKCLPLAKARAMSKENRATAARRKRREDPVADRPGKGNKPINVRTEEMNLEEANKPTNPALWSRAKALAKSKFDVYPSAYANGWAAKWYKSRGGSWKSVSEGIDDEGGMAKGELENIATKAKNLSKMMKKNKQLDSWIQSKITRADHYIDSVHDYLKNNDQEVDEEITKKTFFKLREELDFHCSCNDDIYGSVEEDFEPTGEEQYEDWDIEETQTMKEDWKKKLAGAALAATMAVGAHARVTGDHKDDPNINRLTGKPHITQSDDKHSETQHREMESADKVERHGGFSYGDKVTIHHNGKSYEGHFMDKDGPRMRGGKLIKVHHAQVGIRGLGHYEAQIHPSGFAAIYK
jgi:hypothetical protein